jgi:hypothetical protein
MTAKVGIMEGEQAVIAGQVHDKHVSAATDTDVTIKEAVFSMRAFLGNGAVDTFPQQRRTLNNTRRGVFLSGPPRGYRARTSMGISSRTYWFAVRIRRWYQTIIGETFPALRPTMVSAFCLFAEGMYLFSFRDVQVQ